MEPANLKDLMEADAPRDSEKAKGSPSVLPHMVKSTIILELFTVDMRSVDIQREGRQAVISFTVGLFIFCFDRHMFYMWWN